MPTAQRKKEAGEGQVVEGGGGGGSEKNKNRQNGLTTAFRYSPILRKTEVFISVTVLFLKIKTLLQGSS